MLLCRAIKKVEKQMNFYACEAIIQAFAKLNNSSIRYLLLRNPGDELPSKLEFGKDIDLLIHPNDIHTLQRKMQAIGFKKIKHPLRRDTKLYNINQFEMYINKDGIYLDCNFEIVCRSLNKGEWIPLDATIQTSAWENMQQRSNHGIIYNGLSYDDDFVCMVTRCLLDKRKFPKNYAHSLSMLLPLIDEDKVRQRLKTVFFSFSDVLFNNVKTQNYTSLFNDYLSYSNY